MSLPPRRRRRRRRQRPAPYPTPRLCARRLAAETLKWAATNPARPWGRACRRRAPGNPAERSEGLSAEDGRGGRQQGNPEARASRGPHAQPPSGGPDGSLRGAHWGQQVRLRARAGEALQVRVKQCVRGGLIVRGERICLQCGRQRFESLGREDSPGEENGNPPQYSCLENRMDKGAWRVHGVAKS